SFSKSGKIGISIELPSVIISGIEAKEIIAQYFSCESSEDACESVAICFPSFLYMMHLLCTFHGFFMPLSGNNFTYFYIENKNTVIIAPNTTKIIFKPK